MIEVIQSELMAHTRIKYYDYSHHYLLTYNVMWSGLRPFEAFTKTRNYESIYLLKLFGYEQRVER